MSKIRKIIKVTQRKLICLINYFNSDKYAIIYAKYLQSIGVDICAGGGRPAYIDPSAYIDGMDYRKIHIADRVVISRNVTLLTHDLSLQRIFYALELNKGNLAGDLGDIYIDENSFIGANATLLPGTHIGKNSIVGACAVCKGMYPDNSIIVGNPGRVVKNSLEWGKEKYEQGKFRNYNE